MKLTSRIALVTGATRGIGLETCRQLAEAGVQVLLAGRQATHVDEAVARLRHDGLAVVPLVLDVTQSEQITAAVDAVRSQFGRLDILVNNAGVLRDDVKLQPSQQTLQCWRETFDTNLFAVVEVTRAFLPLLRMSGDARIVNVSSQLASLAWHLDASSPIYDFKIPAYDVSKTAVNAWTIHLAHELRDTGIKVNAIHPGYVQTDMNSGAGAIDVRTGARSSVQMALLDADGPTGTFTHLGEKLPW